MERIIASLLVVALAVATINSLQIARLTGSPADGLATAGNVVAAVPPTPVTTAGYSVIPQGVPAVYGAELGVSFSDVSSATPQVADATIRRLGVLDQQITLSGDDLQRYIAIASQISCEYCCGAKSIIFENGAPACGCAHSFAMRGLAKYLITTHGDEYTDAQVLDEMGKWKVLFFPGQHIKKAEILQQQGIELTYSNLASNAYRGIEKGASASGSGMVGGC
ncbi:MAG: hypothetical protein HY369_04020 [Candidatus Aenigmarchaeota archaeon]|nr:hypothetical protein [Candidatus Aenigmarchaeota archaeon]